VTKLLLMDCCDDLGFFLQFSNTDNSEDSDHPKDDNQLQFNEFPFYIGDCFLSQLNSFVFAECAACCYLCHHRYHYRSA